MLRELKTTVKKLIQAVKNTLPAIAEAMERLRSNMIIFKYQLFRIGRSKQKISQSLNNSPENIAEYTSLVEQIKEKSKERKSVLAEKRATSAIHVIKHRDLTKRITELTEELEELRTEKAMLLRQLQYPKDTTIGMLRKEFRTLEDWLKKIEASEAKYAAELDNALKQYTELQEQATKFDPVELYEVRRAVRPGHEQSTTNRIQDAYGDKYDMLLMYDSKRSVSNLLNESDEERSVREKLRTFQKEQKTQTQRNGVSI